MQTFGKAAAVAAVIATTLFASGCAGSVAPATTAPDGSGELDTLNVASIDIEPSIPLLLGIDEGIFEKHGLDVQTTMSPAFDGTLAAVMNGQADIGFAAAPPMIRAMVKGAPIQAVAQTAAITAEEPGAAVLTTRSDINSSLDLVGKTVAVASLNDLASIGIRVAVATAGGNPADVKFVEMPGPQRVPALLEGKLDAAILIGAPAVAAQANPGVHLVFEYTQDLPEGAPLDVYFSRDDYASKNADVLKRFRAAMTEAAAYAHANPDKVRDRIRKQFADVPEFVAVVDELPLTDYRTDINPDALMKLQDALVEFGGLEKTIPADQFYSFTDGE